MSHLQLTTSSKSESKPSLKSTIPNGFKISTSLMCQTRPAIMIGSSSSSFFLNRSKPDFLKPALNNPQHLATPKKQTASLGFRPRTITSLAGVRKQSVGTENTPRSHQKAQSLKTLSPISSRKTESSFSPVNQEKGSKLSLFDADVINPVDRRPRLFIKTQKQAEVSYKYPLLDNSNTVALPLIRKKTHAQTMTSLECLDTAPSSPSSPKNLTPRSPSSPLTTKTPDSQKTIGTLLSLTPVTPQTSCSTLSTKTPDSQKTTNAFLFPPPRHSYPLRTFSSINTHMKQETTQTSKLPSSSLEFPYKCLFFGQELNYHKVHKHLMTVHKGLTYATTCLKSPSSAYLDSKKIFLPPRSSSKAKTLVLDLDETLVHACTSLEDPDEILWGKNAQGQLTKVPIKVRPYAMDFIKTVGAYYEIVIFTAASQGYAETVVNYFDKDRKYIKHILTRTNCMHTRNGFHIKDLRILKGRELSDIAIVDNLTHSFGFQIDNGIPILEFFRDKTDKELLFLSDYLIEAYHHADIRVYNRERLQLEKMAEKRFEHYEEQIRAILLNNKGSSCIF